MKIHRPLVHLREEEIFKLEDIEEVISLFHNAFKTIEEAGFIVSVIDMSQKLKTFLTERASEQIHHKKYFWTAEIAVNPHPYGSVTLYPVGEDGTTQVYHYRLKYIGNDFEYLSK